MFTLVMAMPDGAVFRKSPYAIMVVARNQPKLSRTNRITLKVAELYRFGN